MRFLSDEAEITRKVLRMTNTQDGKGRPGLWENPSTHTNSAEKDVVTIMIKVQRNSLRDMLRERKFFTDPEARSRKLASRQSTRGSSGNRNAPLSPSNVNEFAGAENSGYRDVLCSCLKQAFPSMFHAFAFFDVERRGAIGERELTNGIKRLQSQGLISLATIDLKELIEQLGQKRGKNGLGLSMSAFARYFYFGDDLTDWKEKLTHAREGRPRRRSSVSSFSQLVLDDKIQQRGKDENDPVFPESAPINPSVAQDLAAEARAVVLSALRGGFGDAALALASLDARQSGVVSTSHLMLLIRRSQMVKDADVRTLREWLHGLEDKSGNILATVLLAAIDGEAGGATGSESEALQAARIALAKRVASESRAQTEALGKDEWRAVHPLRAEVIDRLRSTFANVFDAYLCMAGDDDTFLTAADLNAGLVRVGLERLDAVQLLRELGLPSLPPPPPSPLLLDAGSTGELALLALEFCAGFAWHEIPDWGLGATISPVSRSIEGGPGGLPDDTGPPVLFADRSGNLSPIQAIPSPDRAGDHVKVGTARLWRDDLLSRLATAAGAPRDRVDMVGAEKGNLVLIVYPDPDGRGQPSMAIARRLQAALTAPESELVAWDPDVFKGCEVTLLPAEETAWKTDTSWSLGLRGSSGLTLPCVVRKRRDPWPRSRATFTALGAQAHWRMLDCLTDLQSGPGPAVQESKVRTRSGPQHLCTILRHTSGITIELMHNSFGGFIFSEGQGFPRARCSCEGYLSEHAADNEHGGRYSAKHSAHGSLDRVGVKPASSSSSLKGTKNVLTECLPVSPIPTTGSESELGIGSESGSAVTSNLVVIENGNGTSQSQMDDMRRGTTAADLHVWHTPTDFPNAKFGHMISRKVGRWSICLSVPNIIVLNDCDPNIQLALTPGGFIFFGGGQQGQAVVIEKPGGAAQTTLKEARKIIQHIPTMPNDKTQLDEASISSFQKQNDFQVECNFQDSFFRMLVSNAFPEHCLCTKMLIDLLAIESGLSVHDKVNRRSLSIRLVGESGQACIPGSGSSTELAVLVKHLQRHIGEERRSDIALVTFFRSPHHNFVQVITYIAQQLLLHLPEPRPDALSFENDINDLTDGLEQVMLKLILSNKAVIIILDQAHLAEQRILGNAMSGLRARLQPWLYGIRKSGYIRVVFNGENGYSFPSGIPMVTIQLNGLSQHSVEAILEKKLASENKYIANKHIKTVSRKREAWRWQYLNVVVEVLKHFWVFEQLIDCCSSLPGDLESLYGITIERLELTYGFGEVQSVLSNLISKGSLKISDIKIQNGNEKQDAFVSELRKLLRTPIDSPNLLLHDKDLERAISSRYDENIEYKRAFELDKRKLRDNLREQMVGEANIFVMEHCICQKTPCTSLEEAINLAAAGDTVLLCKEKYKLIKTILVDRDLTIQPDSGIKRSNIQIEQGQPVFHLESKRLWDKPGNADSLPSSHMFKQCVVSISSLSISQVGFEAEEIPKCVIIGADTELVLFDCSVSSDQGIGLVVAKRGKLVMKQSICTGCGLHALLIQRKGFADLISSKFIANVYHEVKEEEQSLHEMFMKCCMGVLNKGGKKENAHLARQMGQRAETLDLNEFIAFLTEAKIFPNLITKTDVADAFGLSTSSNDRELDWRGFRNSIYHICKIIKWPEVCGVKITEDFKFAEHQIAEHKTTPAKWFHSDGVVLDGAESHVKMIDCVVCGAIDGCLVKNGGRLELNRSLITRCGKSRLDAAGILVSGKQSRADISDCKIFMSENNGLVVRYGATCKVTSSTIRNCGKQGLIGVGRGTHIELNECSIIDCCGCGILGGKEARIFANSCKVTSSLDTAVLARYLGTEIFLRSCYVSGNNRGISAENEGKIRIEGDESINDSKESSRKGVLEVKDHNAGVSLTATDAALRSSVVELTKGILEPSPAELVFKNRGNVQTKPELAKIKTLLASFFRNVAEAFVVIDTDAEGTITKSEIERLCSRLGTEINTKALFDELHLTEKSIEEITSYDFLHWFCWHSKDIFRDGRWKELLIEAKRCRRQIMDRLYEHLRQEKPQTKRTKNLEHRLKLRFKNHSIRLRESISRTAIDKAVEDKSILWVNAGRLFTSSKDAISGQKPISRYQSTHGLPGVAKCFDQEKVECRFQVMTTCTLSRYPRLVKDDTKISLQRFEEEA